MEQTGIMGRREYVVALTLEVSSTTDRIDAMIIAMQKTKQADKKDPVECFMKETLRILTGVQSNRIITSARR
jgi:hypothetical protein